MSFSPARVTPPITGRTEPRALSSVPVPEPKPPG
jgi:hypothetical protein